MLLPSDLSQPLAGDKPAGENLEYSSLWDKIREARREDDQLDQGVWQRERKVADHASAIRLLQEALSGSTKDLQLAVWLADSLVARHRFTGLAEGLSFCRELLENVWDDLYPVLENNDVEPRSLLIGWLPKQLSVLVKTAPICSAGYGMLAYIDSRKVPTEEQAKKDKKVNAERQAALAEGKIAPEEMDRAILETPKAFYANAEQDIDRSVAALEALDTVCAEKFGKEAPSFGSLRTALAEVRHVVHTLLQKKRLVDPDPEPEPGTPEVPVPEPVPTTSTGAAVAPAMARLEGAHSPAPSIMSVPAAASDSGDPVARLASAAAVLRARDPHSSAPYLMLRGLRWGELRDSADPVVLEAPPTEWRQQIKRLALQSRWTDLLESAETLMAMPYGRAWLDLQRYVVQACTELGGGYETIALAIRSELRALLTDLPELPAATLNDDTPAANAETAAWLRELLGQPETPLPKGAGEERWRKQGVDPHILASMAMKNGDAVRAIEILGKEVDQQHSGRDRFRRRLQLAQVCVAAGKDAIAQPILDDLTAAMDTHKLEDWEDREFVAGVLTLLLQSSKKIQGDPKLKQAMFERVCRLDPVQALSV